MCGYLCIRSFDFMLKGKRLLKYTNSSSPNGYEKNDKIILKYFQSLKSWENCIALFVVSNENLQNLNYHISYKKHYFFYYFQ